MCKRGPSPPVPPDRGRPGPEDHSRPRLRVHQEMTRNTHLFQSAPGTALDGSEKEETPRGPAVKTWARKLCHSAPNGAWFGGARRPARCRREAREKHREEVRAEDARPQDVCSQPLCPTGLGSFVRHRRAGRDGGRPGQHSATDPASRTAAPPPTPFLAPTGAPRRRGAGGLCSTPPSCPRPPVPGPAGQGAHGVACVSRRLAQGLRTAVGKAPRGGRTQTAPLPPARAPGHRATSKPQAPRLTATTGASSGGARGPGRPQAHGMPLRSPPAERRPSAPSPRL